LPALIISFMLVKAAALFVLCLAFRMTKVMSIRVALLLPQGGEFAFVLFGAALSEGLIDARLHLYTLLMISFSMMITPLLPALADRLSVGERRPIPSALT
jgi:Kef-type K+ transport system membrane component KefB